MRLRHRRHPMMRWVTEEYLATPPTPPSTAERFEALERDIADLERRLRLLGESVAHSHEEAS